MSDWSALFWLIVTFLLMYPLKRWISAHVQGVAFLMTGNPQVAVWLFWVLFLPGTILHELSHWLTAKLLGVKTGKFTIWPKKKRGGELQMGSLQVEVVDPFRYSLVGLAPLIFGSMAVLLIGEWQLALSRLGQALISADLALIGQAISDTLAVPDVWLWLYLLFAISNAMMPSASDRAAWRTVLIYIGLAAALAIAFGFNPTVPPGLQDFILTIVTYLLTTYLIVIAVDLFFIVIILVIETIMGLLLGRRVQYNR